MLREVFIRDMTNDDIEKIAELINELGYPSNISAVSKRLARINSNRSYKTLVAEIDNIVVGFIGLCKLLAYEYDGDYVRIISLVVSEKYRSKGIGRKLVEVGEKWASSEGVSAIALNSGIKRKDAHEFYKRIGYNIKGYGFSKRISQ